MNDKVQTIYMPWPELKDRSHILRISKPDHNPVITSTNVVYMPFHKMLVLFGFMDNGRDRDRIPLDFPKQTTSKQFLQVGRV